MWCLFAARAAGVGLPSSVPAALFVAVWLVYVLDRLLDARYGEPEALELRHHVHAKHRTRFLLAAALAAPLLLVLVAAMPGRVRAAEASLAVLLAAWYAAIHLAPRRRWPKELVVGAFFAAAIYLPVLVAAPPAHDWPSLHTLLPALLLGALCSGNALLIRRWEGGSAEAAQAIALHRAGHTCERRQAGPLTRLALRHLHSLVWALAAVGAVLALWDHAAVPAACAMSALLLLVLNRRHARLDRTTLRALADAALLTPLLWLAPALLGALATALRHVGLQR